MSELSAFLAGLILADAGTSQNKVKTKKLKRNIAMQDIAFLQCLANIMAELDAYVSKEHPTPKEFIQHLLPNVEFEKPLTAEEKKIIEYNNRCIEEYEEWIDDLLFEENLILDDGSLATSWEQLSALRMIWQDKEHTPDFKNLDLLLSLKPISDKPKKYNGSVYEYCYGHPLYGLARDFFTSVPASIILSMCIRYSQSVIEKHGFDYDSTRFDYNYSASKSGMLEEWKLDCRYDAYRNLRKENYELYKITWSNYTQEIQKIEGIKAQLVAQHLTPQEKKRREKEVKLLYNALSDEEKNRFNYVPISSIDLIGKPTWCVIWCAAAVILLTLILCVYALATGNETELPAAPVILIIVFCIITPSLIVCLQNSGRKKAIIELTCMQTEYYANPESAKAQEYAELLKRI